VQVDNSPTVNRDTGANNGEDSDAGDITFRSDIEDAMTRTRKRRKITTTTKAFKTEEESTTTTTSKPATPRRRARKPARKTTDHATGNTGVSPPSDWQEMYDAVLAMREEGGVAANAAVDTMGCERLADRSASPRDQRFHTLVALMLSSQTKDTVNAVVMRRLQTELPAYKDGAPKGLNLENILAVDADKLNELIWTVGFHNNKTK
jgi:endonuclease-3